VGRNRRVHPPRRRRVEIRRETRETQITVRLDLDGRGDFNGEISTGLRFLDHMLAQIAHHGGVSLAVDAKGDLDIDEHHTMEDVAITLGEAIDRALGSKAGIARYGFALPMDDCRALVLLDFGGRIDFEWDASFRRERVGDVPTEMFRHFFHSFACRRAVQPPNLGPRRQRPPQGRSRLQGLRPRPAHGRGAHPFRLHRPQQQRSPMIAVVDYATGNLQSVADALRRAGAEFTLTADPALLRGADKVILPGVGEASSAMSQLRERGLDTVIPSLTQPVLGICIGMQLMCLSSEEGDARCMGIFPTQVLRLPATAADGARLKVPHVGWDTITSLRSPLFDETAGETYVYYVHSFAAEPCAATIATTDYGRPFSAALGSGNFFGTQFHPEKSGAAGARILLNFLNLWWT